MPFLIFQYFLSEEYLPEMRNITLSRIKNFGLFQASLTASCSEGAENRDKWVDISGNCDIIIQNYSLMSGDLISV